MRMNSARIERNVRTIIFSTKPSVVQFSFLLFFFCCCLEQNGCICNRGFCQGTFPHLHHPFSILYVGSMSSNMLHMLTTFVSCSMCDNIEYFKYSPGKIHFSVSVWHEKDAVIAFYQTDWRKSLRQQDLKTLNHSILALSKLYATFHLCDKSSGKIKIRFSCG